MNFHTIEQGHSSALQDKYFGAIWDKSEWESFYRRHRGNIFEMTGSGAFVPAPFEFPSVDFGQDFVVCACAGSKSSSGYSVEIHRVSEKEGRVRVYYSNSEPRGGCVLCMITQPYHFVKVKRTRLPLQFIEIPPPPPPPDIPVPPPNMDTTKLYEILQVPRNANEKEIRNAFRAHARRNHPDKGGDADIYQMVSVAFQILSDANTREKYDRHGWDGLFHSHNNETREWESRWLEET